MTMDPTDKLKDSGLKATLPRMQVLRLFEQSPQRHLAAEDVYRQMLAEGIDLGLATVYRVLAQFEQAGLLRKNQLGAGRAVYELNDGSGHHGHVVSLRDGSVHEFSDPAIDARLALIAREQGFEMVDYVVTVFGRPV
ncbi:MAG: transcriptional repressor [Pseudacidovorax sp.]|nr:transcriptional repressor [Pseudacidovorax sp.]